MFFGINLFAQENDIHIFSEKEALGIIKNYGIDSLEKVFDPFSLVYLNEENAQYFIEKEFSESFVEAHYDSVGIYTYDLPHRTISFASEFNNKKAANYIFDYYKSLPKHIKSDTIYSAYNNLDELLSLLVFYDIKGLQKTLETDFFEWLALAQKTPPKRYKTLEELREEARTKSLVEQLKLKSEDLVVDCNFMAFQIASALQKLGNPYFTTDCMEELKAKQTYFLINRYEFPKFWNQDLGNFLFKEDNYRVFELNKHYKSIQELIKGKSELFNILEVINAYKTCIIYNEKQKAHIDVYDDSGSTSCIFQLKGSNKLMVQVISQILDTPAID